MSTSKTSIKKFLAWEIKKIVVGGHLKILTLSKF